MYRRVTALFLVRTVLVVDRFFAFPTSALSLSSMPPKPSQPPPPAKRHNNNSKHRANNKKNKNEHDVAIVGPDYLQSLTGRLFQKDVTLLLFGESHQDAIDVTRRGGILEAKEGWIPVGVAAAAGGTHLSTGTIKATAIQMLQQSKNSEDDKIVLRVVSKTKKRLPLEKCKAWAKDIVENYEVVASLFLVWIQDVPEARVTKGQAFVLESIVLDAEDELDEDERKEGWFYFDESGESDELADQSSSVPAGVAEWIRLSCAQQLDNTGKNNNKLEESSGRYKTFTWGDLDLEAYELNRRRLTDEDISDQELDSIVNQRKIERRKEKIWTFDDWFSHVRHQTGGTDVDMHLVLESTVPPWELELHRPRSDEHPDNLKLPPAADCIRCVTEDEEESDEEEFDPSSDGVGSYIDFVYRRLMGEMLDEQLGQNQSSTSSTWLHCVDTRRLGCQTECHAGPIKDKWNDMLLHDEITFLKKESDSTSLLPLEKDVTGKFIKFVPENKMNPERFAYEEMKSKGLIVDDEEEEDDENDKEDEEEFTFPSLEGFLGQTSDFLYYDSHVKVSYSPFLAKCVGSLEKWESFFTELFFGGTIAGALSHIDIKSHRDHLYVRSPIQRTWNPETEAYEYRHRDDGEHYITQPFFPFLFYLTAKNSHPSRTWSSELLASLCSRSSGASGQLSSSKSTDSPNDVAMAARDWVLGRIKKHAVDPKGSDDPHCGGEWFEAYLKAVHREIYDDIDTLDCSLLLRKNYMKSESSGRKHNIGKIQIPTCQAAFTEITQRFQNSQLSSQEIVSPRIEVLAKIIIDIWVSGLVDFASVLKVADVVSRSKSDQVVVVCYMGSAHTRAIADFYTDRMNFKKKSFVGKIDWEDETEPHTFKLPSYVWNIPGLFR